MLRYSLFNLFAFAAISSALPNPQLTPDPSGDGNIGNGQGQQFITGACLSNADCGSGCCAGLNGGGICSGPAVGNAQGKTGCGFGGEGTGVEPGTGGDGQQPPEVEVSPTPESGVEDGQSPAPGSGEGAKGEAAGSQNVGAGNGSQFITGQCLSDADCASGCCAGREGSSTAACSAVLVAEADGKTGCGFVQQ